MGPQGIEAHWTRVCDRLRKESATRLSRLVRRGRTRRIEGRQLRLYAPTRFVRDWVSRHYGDRVLAYWQSVNTTVSSVEVNLVPPPPRSANDIIAMPPVPRRKALPATDAAARPRSAAAPRGVSRPRARYTFANFVVASQRFAYAAARNIAEQDRPLPERNRSTFSRRGLGKTHLMHAIWHVIRERDPKQRVLYLTAESFVNRFIQALRTKTPSVQGVVPQCRRPDGRRRQFICGKEATQDEFFFTFNSLVSRTSRSCCRRKSRRASCRTSRSACGPGWFGLVADIHFLDLRTAALHPADQGGGCARSRALACSSSGPQDQLHIRELEGALNRVVAHGS